MVRLFISIILLLMPVNPLKPPKQALKFNYSENNDYEYLISVIKKYEVFRSYPYELFGQTYIGFGSMIKTDHLTEQKADSVLRNEFNNNLLFVMKKGRFLSRKKQLLIAALNFNIGCSKILKSGIYNNDSTFAEKYVKYSYINGKWHKKLNQRRKEEIKILNN
jgi:GH24 family phage-related lysozyme (muramidase)